MVSHVTIIALSLLSEREHGNEDVVRGDYDPPYAPCHCTRWRLVVKLLHLGGAHWPRRRRSGMQEWLSQHGIRWELPHVLAH